MPLWARSFWRKLESCSQAADDQFPYALYAIFCQLPEPATRASHPGSIQPAFLTKRFLLSRRITRTCHLERRAFCAAKDLNVFFPCGLITDY